MTKEEIINNFFHNNNLRCGKIKKLSLEEYKEIFNFYPDSDHIKEVLWRIKLNIDKRPKCKICGKRVKWKKSTGETVEDHYYNTCSRKCGNILGQQHIKENCLLNYGCENHNQRKDVRKKFKQTMLNKYGVEHALQNPESLNKSKQTSLNRYGVEFYTQTNEYKEKYKNTCLKKYGSTSFWQSDLCKQKFFNKHGVNNPMYKTEFTNKISNWWKEHPDHKNTIKQALFKKYGVINSFQIPEVIKKIKLKSKESKIKEYNTKRKNGTLGNKSIKENEIFILLQEFFPNTIRQFTSNLYPFNCDFYIPELDLFIECNFHWTHGGKPYNPEDEECIKQLEHWKYKSENSQFYKNAINTWTIRDVNKRNIAKQNNLNYLEFWNKNEVEHWLSTLLI